MDGVLQFRIEAIASPAYLFFTMNEESQPTNHHSSPSPLDRRSALVSLAAVGVGIIGATMASTATADAAQSMPSAEPQIKVRISSPKDGFISDLLLNDGQKVSGGEILCHLNSEEETRALGRLELAKALLAIEGKKLADDQIAIHRRVLEIGAEVVKYYWEFATDKVTHIKNEAAVRGIPPPILEIGPAEAAVTKANGEVEKAQLALKKFDFNVQQAKARQALMEAQIPLEEALLKSKMNRLEIHIPEAGTLRLLVGKRLLCQKGGQHR